MTAATVARNRIQFQDLFIVGTRLVGMILLEQIGPAQEKIRIALVNLDPFVIIKNGLMGIAGEFIAPADRVVIVAFCRIFLPTRLIAPDRLLIEAAGTESIAPIAKVFPIARLFERFRIIIGSLAIVLHLLEALSSRHQQNGIPVEIIHQLVIYP